MHPHARRPFLGDKMKEGIKVFSGKSRTRYPGSLPVGFFKWLREERWWRDNRLYLCSGAISDPEADRVDIQRTCIPDDARRGHRTNERGERIRQFQTSANIIADARDTGLESESYNWILIDPPYSEVLAGLLYGTTEHFSGIGAFLKEAERLCKPGGYIITVTYEIPPIVPTCTIVARYCFYQIPTVRNATMVFVYRKHGDPEVEGLEHWA